MKVITKETLLPISLVLLIVSITVHLTSVKSLGESTDKRVNKIETKQDTFDQRLIEQEKLLQKIDGKLDILLQKRK